jgi:hypothetical protein
MDATSHLPPAKREVGSLGKGRGEEREGLHLQRGRGRRVTSSVIEDLRYDLLDLPVRLNSRENVRAEHALPRRLGEKNKGTKGTKGTFEGNKGDVRAEIA